MDIKRLSPAQLVDILKQNDVPQDICDLLRANNIDGATLGCLIRDQAELQATFPKSGHRLHLKRAVKEIEDRTYPTTNAEGLRGRGDEPVLQPSLVNPYVNQAIKLFIGLPPHYSQTYCTCGLIATVNISYLDK